jgi:biotin operon repressor
MSFDLRPDPCHPATFVFNERDADGKVTGQWEPTTGPDWEAIDFNCDNLLPEQETLSFSDGSAALALLVGWICQSAGPGPANVITIASKAEAVLFWLDPIQSRYSSLADIARALGITRAAISKQLLDLKDQIGSCVSAGKMSGTRATYRAKQLELVASGKHASDTRRLKKLAS